MTTNSPHIKKVSAGGVVFFFIIIIVWFSLILSVTDSIDQSLAVLQKSLDKLKVEALLFSSVCLSLLLRGIVGWLLCVLSTCT